VIAPPAQRAALEQVTGLMALLEGHGDVTMNRAGAPEIPSAERFARVLAERRRRGTPLTRLVQQLLGIEAKLGQYRAGERFIAAIEAAAGPEAIERCWHDPDDLPTWEEIREPSRWIDRVTVPTIEV
jgi:putative hydrolase